MDSSILRTKPFCFPLNQADSMEQNQRFSGSWPLYWISFRSLPCKCCFPMRTMSLRLRLPVGRSRKKSWDFDSSWWNLQTLLHIVNVVCTHIWPGTPSLIDSLLFVVLKSLFLLMEEILHQLIWQISQYFQGFIHPRWLFGISSINSTTLCSLPW